MHPYQHNFQQTPRISFLAARTPQIIQNSPFQPSRGRFASINSTFMSPIQLSRSPEFSYSQINDLDSIVDLQLDAPVPPHLSQSQVLPPPSNSDLRGDDDSSDSGDDSDSEPQTTGLFDIKSVIETVVNNVSIHDSEIEKRRAQLKEAGETKLLEVFEMLVRRLKKVKKTKEQMVKYCMRKVFRHIGSKNKKSNGRDVSQALREYFGNDKGFDVPFKRNSSDKTMNAAFLTKVFSCPGFVSDYKTYIKNIRSEAMKDNSKKIRALARAIEKLGSIGTPKQLQSLRRLPWTQVIINKVVDLSETLLSYAGQAKNQEKSQTPPLLLPHPIQYYRPHDFPSHQQPFDKPQQIYVPKKMSVIILTPPMGPIEPPMKLDDLPPLQ